MLSMSAADEVELQNWRSKYGQCRLPQDKTRPQPALETALERLPLAMALMLRARLKAGGWLGSMRLEAAEVGEIEAATKMERRELMVMLLDIASALSQTSAEGEYIGAVVEGGSGAIYLGAPLFWKSAQIKFSVHGVQAAVLNAWNNGEKRLTHLMVEVPPCACCRQFLREVHSWKAITIYQAVDGPLSLKDKSLKKIDFSIDGLRLENVKAHFMDGRKHDIGLGKTSTNELIVKAIEAAALSYAPYSNNYAGVALRTKRGDVHRGSYVETVESVAGVLAVEAALTDLALSGSNLTDIDEIILVETRGGVTQFSATQKLAYAMGNIPFRFFMAK